MTITLDCGHEASDREKARAHHGATEVWCPFCYRWQGFVILEQESLFDAETVRESEEAGGREENGQST